MQIEDTYLKSITIKNNSLSQKQFYLIICINCKSFISPVFRVEKSQLAYVIQCADINLRVREIEEFWVEVWEYDYFRKIGRIEIDVKDFIKRKFYKVKVKQFQLKILCETMVKNQSPKQNPNKMRKVLLFPLVKTSDYLLSDQRKDLQINSFKSQQSQPREQESIDYSETSLQNILSVAKQSSLSLQKDQKRRQPTKIKVNEKQFSYFFDDYEACPRQSVKIRQQYNSRGYLLKKQNSTTSSSLVKKNLKQTIKILTENHRKAKNSKIQTKIVSQQWLIDYGLTQSKKIQKKLSHNSRRSKLHDTSLTHDVQGFQQFCQKSLSRDEIKNAQRMTSIELSRSIFEQYGLDLSGSRIHKSREAIQNIQVSERNKIDKRMKTSRQMQRKIGENCAKKNQINFEDYGRQDSLNKKQIVGAQSLQKVKRPRTSVK